MQGPIFSSINFKLLGLSIVLLIIGYICLGQGPVYNPISWSVAPIILVSVYCVLLPLAIIMKEKDEDASKKNQGV